MGKHSKKSVTDAEPHYQPERSGLGANRDNPEQGSLAPSGAKEEAGQGVDGEGETLDTYHKGFQQGYRLGYKQMDERIEVLEKQLAHWKEIAKR
jgi:hypothetical protein